MPTRETIERAYVDLADETYVAEGANRSRNARMLGWLLALSGLRPGGKVLDVGCSAGYFVEAALDRGFDATGLEPSTWLCERARERVGSERVLQGTFEVTSLEGSSFDAVTMWDVLEHVPDPLSFLRRAWGVLRPGGVLLLNVPARDTWMARLLGSHWPLLLPEHLFYFSRRSLEIGLGTAGFESPRFRPHVVLFSVPYVAHRLAQHEWPGANAFARLLAGTRASVPLVMGERTVLARRGERT